MAYPSPNPTLAAHLGTTYKIRHLCNKTVLTLSFWSLHSSDSVRLFTGAQMPCLLGKTMTPSTTNTNSEVILTNYVSQRSPVQSAFFVPLFVGRPVELQACSIGRKKQSRPVSLCYRRGISGRGNMDSWLRGIWGLWLLREIVLFVLGMAQGRFSLHTQRDGALGFGAVLGVVTCHLFIPLWSRYLWNTPETARENVD